MKQSLSGAGWRIAGFLPDEVSAPLGISERIAKGEEYGGEWYDAVVPGDVQSDLIDAGALPDINIGFNARSAEWTYQRDWAYVKRFRAKASGYVSAHLCFGGVDYACDVFLDGKWIGSHENAWIPFSFDVTEALSQDTEHCLEVLVKAAPSAECQWGLTSAVRHLKPRFAYGWDWCTRLVPLGIWQDVSIRYDSERHIDDVYPETQVDYIARRAEVAVHVSIRGSGKTTAQCRFVDPDGGAEEQMLELNEGETEKTVTFHVENAQLWQVNGYGKQPLYTVEVRCGDETERRSVGLRHIEWVRTEGAGEDAIPYQPIVNGRYVKLLGFNFTPVRQLYGRSCERAYEKRVALAKAAHATILRIWGGGLLERETLYDLCDRSGILLMQELFQSSASRNNHPPRDPEYIAMMTETTRSAVRQKRSHPSLAIWCGGNELCVRGNYITPDGKIEKENVEGLEGYGNDVAHFHWIPVTDKYPTIAAMKAAVRELDPYTQWLPTSGSGPVTQNAGLQFLGGAMHDVHGPWTLMPPGEMNAFYNVADMMMHFEFGCPGAASVPVLEKTIPGQWLWPLDENNPAANYHGRMWTSTYAKTIPYFGELRNHRQFSLVSRFLQWDQIRYTLEAHRRLGKKCAGAVLWHMAEPWPNASDSSYIDAYDQPRPGYYGVMEAFKPLHVCAKYASCLHTGSFEAEVSVFNSTKKDFRGTVQAALVSLRGECLRQWEAPAECGADDIAPCVLPIFCETVPEGVFFLRLRLTQADGSLADEAYSVHSSDPVPFRALLDIPEQPLEAVREHEFLKLTNHGDTAICGLTVECGLHGDALFSDGCMLLLPGETRRVRMDIGEDGCDGLRLVGFGAPYRELGLPDGDHG